MTTEINNTIADNNNIDTASEMSIMPVGEDQDENVDTTEVEASAEGASRRLNVDGKSVAAVAGAATLGGGLGFALGRKTAQKTDEALQAQRLEMLNTQYKGPQGPIALRDLIDVKKIEAGGPVILTEAGLAFPVSSWNPLTTTQKTIDKAGEALKELLDKAAKAAALAAQAASSADASVYGEDASPHRHTLTRALDGLSTAGVQEAKAALQDAGKADLDNLAQAMPSLIQGFLSNPGFRAGIALLMTMNAQISPEDLRDLVAEMASGYDDMMKNRAMALPPSEGAPAPEGAGTKEGYAPQA